MDLTLADINSENKIEVKIWNPQKELQRYEGCEVVLKNVEVEQRDKKLQLSSNFLTEVS